MPNSPYSPRRRPAARRSEAIRCEECRAEWLDERGRSRWRAYLTDDEPGYLVFYCPACATREFDR